MAICETHLEHILSMVCHRESLPKFGWIGSKSVTQIILGRAKQLVIEWTTPTQGVVTLEGAGFVKVALTPPAVNSIRGWLVSARQKGKLIYAAVHDTKTDAITAAECAIAAFIDKANEVQDQYDDEATMLDEITCPNCQ